MTPKRLVVLGSSGSIGRQALEVVAAHSQRLQVTGLAAHRDWQTVVEQCRRYGVKTCCLVDEEAAAQAARHLDGVQVLAGPTGLRQLIGAAEADLVLGGISGSAGLVPLIDALQAGIDVALANKEPLVVAGALVTETARASGAKLLPVDSELSAIFQCLQGQPKEAVARIVLTASGGPFHALTAQELAAVTPQQALAHPTWRMGAKVTVDSATLANKGFEIFEARWLFGVDFSRIDVVIHRQSIVHSLVEFHDSAVLAQLGCPDMRVPIQYALLYPDRAPNELPRLNLVAASPLTFDVPDVERFPCLRLAREAGLAGGGYPAVLNGADEAAVELFLRGQIAFTDIPRLVEEALAGYSGGEPGCLEDFLAVNEWARGFATARARQV